MTSKDARAIPASAPRYAIYFAPPVGSPWWEFGARWLGRDESRDAPLPQPEATGIERGVLRELTAAPRHYGFHATLKAPFALADGTDAATLRERVAQLARRWQPLPLGELQATTLARFAALRPLASGPELPAFAAACVLELDDLRAPPSVAELARRRSAGLDARGEELLARYGYPHVLERFRLHFTLSNDADPASVTRVLWAVESAVQRLNRVAPLVLDRLCLFEQPTPAAPFVRTADFVLGQ